VTRPDLPPLDDLIPMLEEIWSSRVLTNGGKFHQLFEKELAAYLDVNYVSLVTNGTLALMVAIRALGLKGEVITTPFTFAATAQALEWCGLKPVFVDIDPTTFNLDPLKIEAAITADTSAVLPVHCYGFPCDTIGIADITAMYNLKVLYDGSHAFGVNCDCGSLLAHGNATTLSFHATKLFNTFEGGAIISESAALKAEIDRLKNFGFQNEISFGAVGTNAKMNEFCAAVGLLQLKRIDSAILRRQTLGALYRQALADCPGLTLPSMPNLSRANQAYFPVLVNGNSKFSRDDLYECLKSSGIHTRRYFYPLVMNSNGLLEADSQKGDLPNSRAIAKSVLCLPIYNDLADEDVMRVCDKLREYCDR